MMPLDLSIAIPALNEGENLALLLPELCDVLNKLRIRGEILVITNGADTLTQDVAHRAGARLLEQTTRGYGGALASAFEEARGAYLITMDADLSHRPTFISDLWRERENAEVVVASRYVSGGSAEMPKTRYLLSRTLNAFFRFGLNLPIRDLSSGFRLYSAGVIAEARPQSADFDVLPELLVRAYTRGWRIKEIPFAYAPRVHGSSHARVFKFGIAYLRTFRSLWRLRHPRAATPQPDRST